MFPQTDLLFFCLIGCALVTALPRILPFFFLRSESISPLLRVWLSFVPVAVLSALLGQELFFYPHGTFNVGIDNLYLIVAFPCLFVAWRYKSFFGTILVGMGFLALVRFLPQTDVFFMSIGG